MTKEEKFKEAKILYETANADQKYVLESLFPELKESEDERIKNFLHRTFTAEYLSEDKLSKWHGEPVANILAWLKKQGEKPQGKSALEAIKEEKVDNANKIEPKDYSNIDPHFGKPIDKTKPKFKVGDWVVNKYGDSWHIDSFDKKNYQVSDREGNHNYFSIANQDEIHLYTIQNTKYGDVLVANNELKFKIGDWVVFNNKHQSIYQVEKIEDGYYILRHTHGGTFRVCVLHDESLRLWNISDAKGGDVLYATGFHNDCIFIFNGLDNWRFDEPNGDRAVATGYCCLSVSADNMEFGVQGPDCIEVNTVKPATKIQRDLLFLKMHESGYEWDEEKKKLKKIEQNPAWNEEDERNLQGIIDDVTPYGECPDYLTDEERAYYYEGEEKVNWLKSLKERLLKNQ